MLKNLTYLPTNSIIASYQKYLKCRLIYLLRVSKIDFSQNTYGSFFAGKKSGTIMKKR